MAGDEPWLRAEMGGTKRASLIAKPEVLVALLKKAKRPLALAGSETITDSGRRDTLIGLIRALQENKDIPVISTAHIAGELIKRQVTPTAVFGSMEIVDRLCDPDWKGLDGKGGYDLILLSGFSYTLGALFLSGLKQGAGDAKVVSLEPKYHPHATWSYGNMRIEIWHKEIERFIDLIHPEMKQREKTDV